MFTGKKDFKRLDPIIYPENMSELWTIKDPLKFETAKKNNLNYIVSYNISEMYNIIEELKKVLNKEDFE